MDTKIKIKLTKDRFGEPLAQVENFADINHEMYPKRMREMAADLLAVADECEAKQNPKILKEQKASLKP